jgi:hypothetical protein
MLIKVTEDHIENGRRHETCRCPIALAIKEATGCSNVSVGQQSATIGVYTHILPKEAGDFVRDFDHRKKVVPFEFELEGL